MLGYKTKLFIVVLSILALGCCVYGVVIFYISAFKVVANAFVDAEDILLCKTKKDIFVFKDMQTEQILSKSIGEILPTPNHDKQFQIKNIEDIKQDQVEPTDENSRVKVIVIICCGCIIGAAFIKYIFS